MTREPSVHGIETSLIGEEIIDASTAITVRLLIDAPENRGFRFPTSRWSNEQSMPRARCCLPLVWKECIRAAQAQDLHHFLYILKREVCRAYMSRSSVVCEKNEAAKDKSGEVFG